MLRACWVYHNVCVRSGMYIIFVCVCVMLFLDNVCDIVIYMYVSVVICVMYECECCQIFDLGLVCERCV